MASMPRAPREGDVNVMEAGMGPGTGDYQYPPQPAQNQESRVSNFVDGSGPIFSMYIEMATEEDEKMAENWKADADGILIFTGLFSAAVASLISVSIQDIRPNPQDTSNFYLANIYQTVANPNISSSLPASPPPFSPPNYAIWVNSLWFMSLVISLTCALLATLLQQWARRYLKVTQSRYSPHKRARIRAFFAEGVDKFLLPWVVETLPALLHISLFLFFVGLAVFLFNVYITIFKLVLSWVGACTAVYGCITFMPIFRHDSPYYTSLSSFVWFIVFGIRHVIFYVPWWFSLSVHHRRPFFWRIGGHWYDLLVQGIQRTAEKTALDGASPEIGTRAFMWTFDCLDEDHELERFFSGLPGIRSSKVVDDPLPSLTEEAKEKLSDALIGFFDRTFSSDLLPGTVKNYRAIICAKAFDPVQFPYAFWSILGRVISDEQHRGLQTAEFVRVMGGWRSGGDQEITSLREAIFTCLIARAQRDNDSWLISAPNKLGIPEADLRRYATDGSLSLRSLINITRHQFSQFGKSSWRDYWFSDVLKAASEFNARDTSPDLQHEFCALWNQIVLKAQNDHGRQIATRILRPIRNIYIALHQGTDSAPTQFSASTNYLDGVLNDPTSYPQCNVVSHIHDSASITLAHSVPHDNDAPLSASVTSPDVPSSSVPVLPHVVKISTDMPTLDDFHPRTTHKTTTEGFSIPVTSPDPATANASGIIVFRPTSTTSKSAPPLSSTSPPVAPAVQHNADLLAPSNLPNHPSASHPILDNTDPTGLPPSSHSSMTRSDPSPSFTECHRSVIVPAASCIETGPVSAPDLGAAAKDDGSPKPGPHKDRGMHSDPASAIRAIPTNTMATLDLPPLSPPLSSVTDMDPSIAGPLLREPNAERTGDLPLNPLHCLYDIV
ncbi:hypothetical protein EDB87DRAFT_1836877 [Lactarius vividus]|nr:hypothetical protein EDB87DRAFT_1836877 [Lactarius vividus]